MKKDIRNFVTAIIDQKHKSANDLLTAIINKKIKQKIINNNSNIFLYGNFKKFIRRNNDRDSESN